jgi:hypothetical protein
MIDCRIRKEDLESSKEFSEPFSGGLSERKRRGQELR